MTATEAKLAAACLREASRTFSNNGCNDFDLMALVPDQDERDALVLAYFEWNGDPEEYYEQQNPAHDWRLQDWMLMDFLAHRLEA